MPSSLYCIPGIINMKQATKHPKRKSSTRLMVVQREKLMRDDPEEWCILLGLLGYAHKCIANEVGIPLSSVGYYLGKRGVKLAMYRNAESALSRAIIRNTAQLPSRSQVRLNFGEQRLKLCNVAK